jgi:hypothetical protein
MSVDAHTHAVCTPVHFHHGCVRLCCVASRR